MKPPAAKTVVVHELDSHNQHRVVCLYPDGTSESGNWVPQGEVAFLGEYFANCNLSCPLPPGVFRVRDVSFRVLTS